MSYFQEIDLLNYLRDELDDKEKQLFLVVTQEVEQKQNWLKDAESYNNATRMLDNLDAEIVNLKDVNIDQCVENNIVKDQGNDNGYHSLVISKYLTVICFYS